MEEISRTRGRPEAGSTRSGAPGPGHLVRRRGVPAPRCERALAAEAASRGSSLGPSRAPPEILTLIGKSWEKARDAAALCTEAAPHPTLLGQLAGGGGVKLPGYAEFH